MQLNNETSYPSNHLQFVSLIFKCVNGNRIDVIDKFVHVLLNKQRKKVKIMLCRKKEKITNQFFI